LASRPRNPNWPVPQPSALTPVGVNGFESVVADLGLTPDQYEHSAALQNWVRKNKNQRYVPPELLQAWGMEVD
jgi:hypothetical protein